MTPRAPRFSQRTAWAAGENALARAVRARRAGGHEIIDLTAANPTRAAIPYPDGLLELLTDERALSYEPEALGHEVARGAVAAWYRSSGVIVDPGRVVITASTSEAYAYLFEALCDVGDSVLAPAPSYPLFAFLADVAGVELVPYPLAYDGGWHIDLAALEAAIGPRTRAVVVVSPNNPTGAYLKRDERAAIEALAAEHGLAVIADEVFAGYPLRPDAARAPSIATAQRGLSFALSGLSKVAGLPQLKLGWIVVAGEDAPVASALARLELLSDTFLSVGTPVQLAAPGLLSAAPPIRSAISERTIRNLHTLTAALAAPSPATVLDVEGGWNAVIHVPNTRSEEAWALALLGRGVLVHPGHFFDFSREAFVVVSLLAPESIFDRGVARIVDELATVA